MFGALEFSDKMAGSGIQPIVGCELAVDFGDQDPNARNALPPVARWCCWPPQERGYRSLMRLNSRAFLETPDTPRAASSSSTGWTARPKA